MKFYVHILSPLVPFKACRPERFFCFCFFFGALLAPGPHKERFPMKLNWVRYRKMNCRRNENMKVVLSAGRSKNIVGVVTTLHEIASLGVGKCLCN